jgi:hypothetical protein
MKVSPNGPIYLPANFHIFLRSLANFAELFLLLCHWKREMNIGNPFLFSYWAGPANPTRPTWIHNRARPWDPLGSHYLSSSPIVGASPVFAARAPRETLLAALRQAPSPRFPAPRAFPATHPDWRPSLRRFATPQLPPSVTEPPPPVGHNSSWH